jgi:hypothetical protein
MPRRLDEGIKHFVCYSGRVHAERVHLHFVHRGFTIGRIALAEGIAHQERAAGHDDI